MMVNDVSMGTSFRIFCDLDGVLVDFISTAIDVTGINLDADSDKDTKAKFWARINKYVAKGNPFFAQMNPTNDARVLWNYINQYDTTILSSTGGRIPTAEAEKREWVARYLGEAVANSAIITSSTPAKAQYAASNHILIDDRMRAIQPWVESGGIGILHTSATNTIQQLRELGL